MVINMSRDPVPFMHTLVLELPRALRARARESSTFNACAQVHRVPVAISEQWYKRYRLGALPPVNSCSHAVFTWVVLLSEPCLYGWDLYCSLCAAVASQLLGEVAKLSMLIMVRELNPYCRFNTCAC